MDKIKKLLMKMITNTNIFTSIKNYNDMTYGTRLVKYSDFMSNKYNMVHKKIYTMALDKYINEWLLVKKYILDVEILDNNIKLIENEINNTDDKNKIEQLQSKLNNLHLKSTKLDHYIKFHKNDKYYIGYKSKENDKKDNRNDKYIFDVNTHKEFIDNSLIIEIMNDEYWKPSWCKITTKFKNKLSPNLSWKVNLAPYWNTYQDNINKTFNKMKLSDSIFSDAKIISVNYVTGKAKLYSENINKEFEVDFDQINANNVLIDESMSLENTFNDLLIEK